MGMGVGQGVWSMGMGNEGWILVWLRRADDDNDDDDDLVVVKRVDRRLEGTLAGI